MAGELSIAHKYVADSSDDQRMLMDLLEIFSGNGGSMATLGGLVSVKDEHINCTTTVPD